MRSLLVDTGIVAPPKIDVPPSLPPTPEEIARRRAHFAKMMEHREAIGPIDIPTDELVRAARQDLGDDVPIY